MNGGFQVGPFQPNYQQQGAVVAGVVNDGGRWPVPRRRDKKRLPEDYERERKMLDEYLNALEKPKPAKFSKPVPKQAKKAEVAPQPVVPRLTEAMAQVAEIYELQRIEQRAAAEDRRRAEEERYRRRRAAASVVLMLSH